MHLKCLSPLSISVLLGYLIRFFGLCRASPIYPFMTPMYNGEREREAVVHVSSDTNHILTGFVISWRLMATSNRDDYFYRRTKLPRPSKRELIRSVLRFHQLERTSAWILHHFQMNTVKLWIWTRGQRPQICRSTRAGELRIRGALRKCDCFR